MGHVYVNRVRFPAVERLDALDIRIIKEIQSPASFRWDARESFARLGRKLGVDEETVRKRLARMDRTGVFGTWRLLPNPHAIGQEICTIDLESVDETRKAASISQVKLVEGVFRIFDYQGGRLGVLLCYDRPSTAVRRVQLLSSICRARRATYWELGFPSCDFTLKKLDWRIVASLENEPRKRVAAIARELQVSTRTIRRRLTLMTNGNAFFVLPVLDLTKIHAVPCNFRPFCPDPAKKGAMDRLILATFPQIFFSHTAAKGHSSFSLACANVAEAEEIRSRIAALDGVQEVRMSIIRRIIPVHDWLHGEIERKLLESGPEKGHLLKA